jgi:deoxyadenosine/deoxycytidine kinase
MPSPTPTPTPTSNHPPGNISAGKSTLCRDLASELGFELFLEPVVTNPYLELYYGDAKAYGLAMQLWLLRQRYETKTPHTG